MSDRQLLAYDFEIIIIISNGLLNRKVTVYYKVYKTIALNLTWRSVYKHDLKYLMIQTFLKLLYELFTLFTTYGTNVCLYLALQQVGRRRRRWRVLRP